MVAEVGGKDKLDGGLDVLGAESALLLRTDELGSLEGELLEHVDDQRVDDAHRLLADADVAGNALEDLVDVEGEGLVVLAVASSLGLLLGCVACCCACAFTFSHFDNYKRRNYL